MTQMRLPPFTVHCSLFDFTEKKNNLHCSLGDNLCNCTYFEIYPRLYSLVFVVVKADFKSVIEFVD